jgi:hypothetical protein
VTISVTLCSADRDIANEDGPLGNVGLLTSQESKVHRFQIRGSYLTDLSVKINNRDALFFSAS